MRYTWIVFGGPIVVALVWGLWSLRSTPSETTSTIQISATIYPLAEFARAVGGERVTVTTVVPSGVEPHEFEPSPKTLSAVYASDLFVMNGGGIDGWAAKMVPDVRAQGVRVQSMRDVVTAVLPAPEADEAFDEHYWLSPVAAQAEVLAIRDALMALDVAHAEEYRARAEAYVEELQALDRRYADTLATCQFPRVVTSHAVLGYLARAYGFEQMSITGLSPEQEPSAAELAQTVEEIRAVGARTVLAETLVSPALAQTLAQEVGASVLVFNPLEGLTEQEAARGETYVSISEKNLTVLAEAMVCTAPQP